ncbi:FUSC family protein, partial [Streptomyces sp. NPDC059466]
PPGAEPRRAPAPGVAGGPGPPGIGQCRLTARRAAGAAADLRGVFDTTPYRPTGLSTGSRAIVRLVDELTWLSGILADSAPPLDERPACEADAHAVRRAAARVLDEAAGLLDVPMNSRDALRSASDDLGAAMAGMERDATGRLSGHHAGTATPSRVHPVIGVLDLSFRAQELGFATLQIANNVDLAASAERRSWHERLLGREPGTLTEPLVSARERAPPPHRPPSGWRHTN